MSTTYYRRPNPETVQAIFFTLWNHYEVIEWCRQWAPDTTCREVVGSKSMEFTFKENFAQTIMPPCWIYVQDPSESARVQWLTDHLFRYLYRPDCELCKMTGYYVEQCDDGDGYEDAVERRCPKCKEWQ